MANTKLTALAGVSVPTLADLLYYVQVAGPTSDSVTVQRLLGVLASNPQARLTTVTATPVPLTDQAGAGTIFWTPYRGSTVRIYDGTRWQLYSLVEISLALAGLTNGKNYDVFVFDNAGTLTLELSAAWTTDTARADALALQDGILVKSADHKRLYLGTIRATAAATTEDSGGGGVTQVGGKRFVWNYYNRVRRALAVFDSTDTWAYAVNTWRQANAAAGNKVEFLVGWPEDIFDCEVLGGITGNGEGGVAIGLDSTTTPALLKASSNAAAAGTTTSVGCSHSGLVALPGYHYLAWLEIASAAITFLGDNGTTRTQSGLLASILA